MFKEFKEMALRGGIVAPINKERLETALGIRFRAFGTDWRYDCQSDGMLARIVRPDGNVEQLEYMKKEGVAGTTTGGRTSGSEKVVLHHQKQNPAGQ